MKNFNTKSKTVAKKLLAIIIVFTIILAHFATVGSYVVEATAEALEKQNTITKGNNVEFDAYFEQNGERTHTGELLAEETQKLYVQLTVKDKVSVPSATIKIEDSNFSIKKDEIQENKYVKDINTETNEIQLENLSSNNIATIELPIQLKKQDKVSNEYFNKEITLKLEGTYENINQKEKELSGEVKIKPQWTSKTDIALTQSIQKYFSLGEKGTLLEQQVETQVENNVFPRREETVEIKAPNIGNKNPSNVKVLIDGERVDENQAQYTQETGIVKITYQNQKNSEQDIDWKSEKRVYNVIYQYTDAVPVQETSITLSAKTQTSFYAQTDTINKEETKEEIIEPIGNIATVETFFTGDIYKGYLYENEAKEIIYEENNQITVSYIEEIGNMVFETNNETYANENGESILPAENIRYVQTAINKEQLISLLGEEGRLSIKRANGEEIASIGNETQTDESGNIVVNYENAEKDIIIETTKPQKEGKLNILNKKAISGEVGQPREVVKTFKSLVTSPTITTSLSKEGTTSATELKETTSEAKIELNRENLSTVEVNQDVEIKAILSSNSQSQDLYANPSIMIEFPTDVQEVNVKSIDKLYGDEFTEVRPSQGVIDGKQTIYIELIGEQTTHKETGIEGTIINIKADIKLDKKATSKQNTIKMAYTNEKANQYTNGAETGIAEKPIEIVSPKGLITTNNIEALQIETAGEEKDIEKEIATNSSEQVYTVESEIINNNEDEVNNVKILGTFGTKGVAKINEKEYQNNIDSALQTALTVEGVDANKVKVYYTENENATENVEDPENKWQQTVTSTDKTKKYLVEVDNMSEAQTMKLSYNIAVPANLQYKQQMYQGYSVAFNDNQANSEQEVEATTIALKTAEGPSLTANLTARVGADTLTDGAEVQKNEVVTYRVTVTNNGSEDITDAKLQVTIPEGTKLIERKALRIFELEGKEKEIEVGQIKVNETKTITFEEKIDKTVEEGISLTTSTKLIYDQKEYLNNFNLKVGNQKEAIQVLTSTTTHSFGDDGSVTFKQGDILEAYTKITNTTENEIKNVEVKWNVSPELARQINRLDSDINSNKNEETIKINSIGPGEYVTIYAKFEIESINNDYVEISSQATYDNNVYRGTNEQVKVRNSKGIDFTMTSDVESGALVNPGNTITYTLSLNNKDDYNAGVIEVLDEVPQELTIKEIVATRGDGTQNAIKINNNINHTTTLLANETITITIKTIANYTGLAKDKEITNKAILKEDTKVIKETEEIKHTIKSTLPSQNPNNPSLDPNDPSAQGTISGYAWIDKDINGEKNDYENTVENMTVKLLNVETNKFAKDKNGNQIQALTDNTGLYTLKNVPKGEYVVVFEYDTRTYKITKYQQAGVDKSKNSKAISKTLNIEGQERTYGITDILKIQENLDIRNMNIGLVTTGKFDFSLEKYISRITVRTNDGNVKTYNYNKETLAKVEIAGKKLKGASVIVEYNIEAKNVGEISGYVKTIEDNKPDDMVFSSELNKDWYQSGTVLKTNSLQNKIIAPGESETIKLILTKTMTENNTGIMGNTAEITETYNEEGIQDFNSTPGNGDKNEDDYGKADTIVSIKTGAEVVNTLLILILISIIGISVFIIRRDSLEMEIDENIFKGL